MEAFIAVLILLAAIGIGFGAACCSLASKKGHSTTTAFWLGLFFGLFALLGYAIARPATRECPTCHEPNYFKRTTCKMCGSPLQSAAAPDSQTHPGPLQM